MVVNIKTKARFDIDRATDSMQRTWAGWDVNASDQVNWNHNRGRHTFGERVDREEFATVSFDGRIRLAVRITGKQQESNPSGTSRKWSLEGVLLPPGDPMREALMALPEPPDRTPIRYLPDPEPIPLRGASSDTFLLTNNPDRFELDPDQIDGWVQATAAGYEVEGRWSTGSTSQAIRLGDRAFLLRQGTRGRGIVAKGRFVSDVFQDDHWDDSGREANYADVLWDVVLDPTDRLPIEILQDALPSGHWQPQGSGRRLTPTAASGLEDLWRRHVDAIRGGAQTTASGPVGRHNLGQGRLLDAGLRREIEDLAQERLTTFFEDAGWTVEDCRHGNPFDARAVRNGVVRYLEAKGTTTPGERVIVTRGEVNWARSHRGECVMGVLAGIVVTADASVDTSSGTLSVFDWLPDEDQLEPIEYDFYPDYDLEWQDDEA